MWRPLLSSLGIRDGSTTEERLQMVLALSDEYTVNAGNSSASEEGRAGKVYFDPYYAHMVAHNRDMILDLALDLESEGRTSEAAAMAARSLRHCPTDIWPMQPQVVAGEVRYNGLETARLLIQYGDAGQRILGHELLDSETERHEAWERYWRAMPVWRRSALSPRTVNMAAGAPRARALRALLSR